MISMKYIEKSVESIKLAYMSHTPIVWIVTPTIETANYIALSFANEHFGGIRINQNIGKGDFVYKSLSTWGANSASNHKNPCIYFDWIGEFSGEEEKLKDIFAEFLGLHLSLEIEKAARPIIDENRQNIYLQSMIIIASPTTPDMGWLNRYIDVIYVGSMLDNEIKDILVSFFSSNNVEVKKSFIEQLVVNFRGVSIREIYEILTKCLVSEYFDYDSLENHNKILNEIRFLKRQMLNGFNGLKWIPVDSESTPASGLGAITTWLNDRKEIFTDPEKKQREGFDVPKGILVTGIPGTGKSLMAKETARILRLPLIAMDLGDIQEGIVGKSEERMASALRMVDAMAPCVLWIDEIEKAFSGANSGQSDGGVMRRMFGKFLTWMQEKQSFCFVFATSNDISQLPPELFRSERFDEKFYNFMPTADECAEIFIANISYHDRMLSKENDKDLLMFDGALKQKQFWLDFLNNKNRNPNDDSHFFSEVTLQQNGLWEKGCKPQKKLFTGADISAFVKLLKFKILQNRSKKDSLNYGHAGPITKKEVDDVIYELLLDFMPYGQTNLNDVALCFLALSKNRFKPSSISKPQIIDFNDFNEETEMMKYNPEHLKGEDNNYNRCLYMCVVGAINNIAQKKRHSHVHKLNSK